MNPSEHDAHDDGPPLPGRRLLLTLTAVWAVITFVPPLFAHTLRFELFGLPFALWVAAQGAPIVYVLLVWVCERRSRHLERPSATDGDGR